MLLTYLLLAPATAPVPGLHLGAIGMAIKTSLYGVLSALVYDWVNCRYFRIRYWVALAHKAIAALVVGATALGLVGVGGSWLHRMGANSVTALCAASCVYAATVALLVLLWPALAGITRRQLLRSVRLGD